jgi:hypothetical protein
MEDIFRKNGLITLLYTFDSTTNKSNSLAILNIEEKETEDKTEDTRERKKNRREITLIEINWRKL